MCEYKTSRSTKHILIIITETNLMLNLSLVINSIRHSKQQHKLNMYQTVFYNSANSDTLVVPLSNDFYTIGCERVDTFIQYIYAYVC